jgi:hypothetical protein
MLSAEVFSQISRRNHVPRARFSPPVNFAGELWEGLSRTPSVAEPTGIWYAVAARLLFLSFFFQLLTGAFLEEPRVKDKHYRKYASGVERALSLFDTTLQEWADYISFLNRLLKVRSAARSRQLSRPSPVR